MRFRSFLLAMCVLALGTTAWAQRVRQEDAIDEVGPIPGLLDRPRHLYDRTLINDVLINDLQPSSVRKYWIGVSVSPSEPGQEAVTVLDVMKGTPADKAGLKKGDVIRRVDETDLTGPEGLIEAVQKSEGKPLKITVKRGEEELTVEVTPEERDVRALTEGPFFQWRAFGPAIVWDELDAKPFPQGVSMTVRTDEDGKAVITVKRGDEEWVVHEDELDKLPEDLRPWARRILQTVQGLPVPGRVQLPEGLAPDILLRFPGDRVFRRRWLVGPPDVLRSDDADEKIEDRLNQLDQQISELRKMIEELKSEEE